MNKKIPGSIKLLLALFLVAPVTACCTRADDAGAEKLVANSLKQSMKYERDKDYSPSLDTEDTRMRRR